QLRAVGERAEAVAAPGQAQLVEQGFSCRSIVLGIECLKLGLIVRRSGDDGLGARRALTEENDLVDRIAVNRQRERAAEVEVLEQLAILRIGVALVDE